MATEPADSADRKEVPEMVRARQLGIADQVSGLQVNMI
jgi:hypothetical protein